MLILKHSKQCSIVVNMHTMLLCIINIVNVYLVLDSTVYLIDLKYFSV